MHDLVITLLDADRNAIHEWRVPLDNLPPNNNASRTMKLKVEIKSRENTLLYQELPPWADYESR